MKKRFAVLSMMIVALFVMFASIVYAEQQYALEEIRMNVSIPDKYEVVIRGSENESDYVPEFNISREEMLTSMEENDIYLDAFDYDSTTEIFITATDIETIDFNFIRDELLLEWADEWGSDWEDTTVHKKEVYENDSMKYIKFYAETTIEDIEQYRVQYYTCYNGKAFNIFYISFLDEIDDADENEIKGIIDSIVYDAVRPDITTEAFTYVDPTTQLSFNVPAGYIQAEEPDENGLMTFESEQNNTMHMMYGSKDVWDEVSEYKRSASSRLEIDHSALFDQEISTLVDDYYEVELEFIGSVSYGDKEYLKCIATESYSDGVDEVVIDMVMLIHIEDGYLYSFFCSAKEGSVYFDDFEALVSGIKYPQISESQLLVDYMEDSGLDIILSFILTFTIYSLPIVIYRYGIRKFCVEKRKALKITIIYGICSFVVMCVILVLLGSTPSGTAIFIWGCINYLMLSKGRDCLTNYNIPDTSDEYNDNGADKVNDYNLGKKTVNTWNTAVTNDDIQIKKKEVNFIHTCPRCNNKFKLKYNMPEYRKEVPDLEVVCPKCKIKMTIRSEELKNSICKSN